MENLDPKKGIGLISTILNVSFEKGWITEVEKLRVESKTTVDEKKLEIFELLKTIMDCENALRLLSAFRCINMVEVELADPLTNEGAKDMHQFTTILMSKLFEKSLITEEERLTFEKQFNVVKAVPDGVPESITKAMLLNPVIRCVLQYLSLRDIKNCRFVSREWRSASQRILRARSKIIFLKDKKNWIPDGPRFSLCEFYEQFSSTLETIPFTSFRICCQEKFPWAVQELSDFFLRQKNNIKELEMVPFPLTNPEGVQIDSFNITAWISSSPMAKANTKYRTKLSVKSYNNKLQLPITRIIIQNSVLANIQELSLSRCQINLEDQIQLCPMKLTLYYVSFCKDGKMLSDLCINDIVDLSRTNYINITCSFSNLEENRTRLSLDFGGNDKLNLNFLYLHEVKITNCESCTWEVNKLEMSVTPFIEKTDMLIQELDLSLFQSVNLSFLPKTLKILTIDFEDLTTDLNESEIIILENLGYLALKSLNDQLFLRIHQILKCPNLVDLYLDANPGDNFTVNSDWIPKSVKRMKVCRGKINWLKNTNDFNLDKLILIGTYFCIPQPYNILCKAKEFVLYADEAELNVLDLVAYLHLWKSHGGQQRIYVGTFNWMDEVFEESPLIHYVDREARYYVFQDQKGVALDISISQFEELKGLEPNKSLCN